MVLLLQASGCCVTATAPLSPRGCSEFVTFRMKFWTPVSNFSTFTQKARMQVHTSLSAAGGPLQVLGGPLLVLRFTPWLGWPVGVLSLVEATGSQAASQRDRVSQTPGFLVVFWLSYWPWVILGKFLYLSVPQFPEL